MPATLLLYTGRLMDDKGIRELANVVDRVRKSILNALLVVATTHIAPDYYNSLAASLSEAIIFYRLERTRLVQLYHAADIFLCCATSVFETYGKSPLEAIAAGVPVVVPRWDGFPHYVGPQDGLLAEVIHGSSPIETPFQFSQVDTSDCADKCIEIIRNPAAFRPCLPEWGRYSVSVTAIQRLVDEEMANSPRSALPPGTLAVSESSRIVLETFGLDLQSLSLESLQACGLLGRREIGPTEVRLKIHQEIFA